MSYTQIHKFFHLVPDNLKKKLCGSAGLSMNILHTGDKSPLLRDFRKNSTGDLLPVLRFLDELYNFYNFVNYIFFNVSLDGT